MTQSMELIGAPKAWFVGQDRETVLKYLSECFRGELVTYVVGPYMDGATLHSIGRNIGQPPERVEQHLSAAEKAVEVHLHSLVEQYVVPISDQRAVEIGKSVLGLPEAG